MLEFSIISITSFVTILDSCTILIAKPFTKDSKKDFKRFIPLCSIVYGVLLGILGYYMPSVDMGTSLIEAIFVGLSAGAAATGVNQVGKQLGKDDSMSSIIMYLKQFVDAAQSLPVDDNEIPPTDDEVEDTAEEDIVEEETTEDNVEENDTEPLDQSYIESNYDE